MLNLDERPAAPKPLSEIVAEARQKGATAASIAVSLEESKQHDLAGWGGADEPEADWHDDGSDGAGNAPWFEGDKSEESDWGEGLDR